MFVPCGSLCRSRSGHDIHNPFVKSRFQYFFDLLTFSLKCVINTTCDKPCYILPIDCLLVAYCLLAIDAHMLRYNMSLSNSLGIGPGPISMMAEHKGKQ